MGDVVVIDNCLLQIVNLHELATGPDEHGETQGIRFVFVFFGEM